MKNYQLFFICLFCITSAVTLSAQQHPYLFFTDKKIESLKEQIKTNGDIHENYNYIKGIANKSLNEENPYLKIDYLALTYQISGDKKYADKIKECIRILGKKQTLEASDMLNRKPAWTSLLTTAHANFLMSIGFDAIYNDLSFDERTEFAQYIYHIGIQPTWDNWLSPTTRFHSINSMGHNYWVACIGMMGIASMAVINEIPEAADWLDSACKATSEWVRFNGDILQNKPANFDNGAYYESVSYANYGISEYLYFQLALQNYTQNMKWNDKQLMEHTADYFIYTSYPSDGDYLPSLYFGDSSMATNGEAVLKLLWALGIQKPETLWYLSQVRADQQKEGMPANTPMGIMYTPDLSKKQDSPLLPLSIIYEKMGWATMRSTWNKNSTLLGVKCGHTWNHSHADAGSFILFHNGQQVIKDAGNCWYPNPSYREYFFQSQAHNVLLFEGKAQPEEQQYKGSMLDGSLHHLIDSGNIKYILANATGPTSRYFAKNHRSFLWIDDVILIIDDARVYDYGNFSLLFHPDGESRKNGIDINIVNNNSSVNIRPIWPEYLTESSFEHDFPDNLKIEKLEAPRAKNTELTETYYSVTNPNKAQRTKFITAIVLKDTPNSKIFPEVTQLKEETDLLGVRISYKGKITEVFLNERADGHIMHRNSCTTIKGWDTDAYLLAFSYKEGLDPTDSKNISEWFIGYGSYVRNGQNDVFNSFTKKYAVLRNN